MTRERNQLGRAGRTAVAVVTVQVLFIMSVLGVAAQSPSAAPEVEDAWHLASVDDDTVAPFVDIVKWGHGFAALGWPENAYLKNQGLDVPVWLSEDGSTWRSSERPIRLPSKKAAVRNLAAFQGGLMAFGSEGTRLVVWRSEDGQRWRRTKHQSVFEAPGVPTDMPYGLQVVDAVAADGHMVVSGEYGAPGDTESYQRVWASRNGRTWETDTPIVPYPASVLDLGAGPRGHLGTVYDRGRIDGCAGGKVPIRSGNGVEWRVVTKARPVCHLESMAYDKTSGRYYATTWDGHRGSVMRSKDRRTWREVFELSTEFRGRPMALVPYALHVGDGIIAVVGEGSRVDADDNTIDYPFAAVSDDGREWYLSVAWPDGDAPHRSSVIGHGRLTVAAGGQLWYADLADLGVEPKLRVPLPDKAVKRPGPPPRYRPGGPATAVSSENGIKTELWIKDDTLDRGQWLLAHLRVTNTGSTPVKFSGTFERLACPPIEVELDTRDAHDRGREWTGTAAEFKDEILDSGWWTKAELRIPERDRSGDCRVGQSGSIAPGESVDIPLAGLPRYLRKRPLPAGPLHVTGAFEGKRDGKKVTSEVTTDVQLAGDPVHYRSPAQLVDVALETRGFLATLEDAADQRWANSHLALWDGPPYPDQPRLDAGRDAPNGLLEIVQFMLVPADATGTGLTERVAGVVVDPWTGESFGAYVE